MFSEHLQKHTWRRILPATKLKKPLDDCVGHIQSEFLRQHFEGQVVLLKKYAKRILKDTPEEICRRLEIVSEDSYGLAPKFRWAETEDTIVTVQRFLKSAKNRVLREGEVAKIARKLDIACDLDLVHGDIDIKNIVVAWEHSLQQERRGSVLLMGTIPYVHPEDRKRFKLSVLTDLLGFHYLVIAAKHGRDAARKLISESAFLTQTARACGRLAEAGEPFRGLLLESDFL